MSRHLGSLQMFRESVAGTTKHDRRLADQAFSAGGLTDARLGKKRV
jgi:hypothetical protein